MSAVRWIVLVGALLASLASGCESCGGCGDEKDEGEPGTGPAPRPTSEQTEAPAPTIEQLPLAQDFALHAGQRVTEENYRAELDRIEQEVGPVPEAARPPSDEAPAGDQGPAAPAMR